MAVVAGDEIVGGEESSAPVVEGSMVGLGVVDEGGDAEVSETSSDAVSSSRKRKRGGRKRKEHYSRNGIYSMAVECADPVPVGVRGAASVWGAVWRVLVLLGLCVPFTYVHALYFVKVDPRIHDFVPGMLGFVGIDWSTWYGSVVVFLVNMAGCFAPMLAGMSQFWSHFSKMRGKRGLCWPGLLLPIVSLPMVMSCFLGDDIGESMWWEEFCRHVSCRKVPDYDGIKPILPGLLGACGAVLLVVVLWLTVGHVARRGRGGETKWSRAVYALGPVVANFGLFFRHRSSSAEELGLGLVALAMLFGEFMPNELGAVAFAIRTRRPAHWLWSFAIVIVWETWIAVLLITCAIYGL